MKIDLAGDFEVIAPASEVYRFLTDPTRFAPLLPMFKELSDVQEQRFRVVLDVGVPQIRGRAEANVQFVEQLPDQRAALRSNVRHSLGMADTEMGFTLEPQGSGTRVLWTCSSTVRGMLASLASGILAPLARRNVDAMIASVQQELGAVPAAADALPAAAAATTEARMASAPPAPAAPGASDTPGWWARIRAWWAGAFGVGRAS